MIYYDAQMLRGKLSLPPPPPPPTHIHTHHQLDETLVYSTLQNATTAETTAYTVDISRQSGVHYKECATHIVASNTIISFQI